MSNIRLGHYAKTTAHRTNVVLSQSHSEVPENDEDWPSLCEILEYRDRVRARLMAVYDDFETGKRTLTRRIARVLQMTLEHEGFHIEVCLDFPVLCSRTGDNNCLLPWFLQTLLYMLMQRAGSGTVPPPGFTTPPWTSLRNKWAAALSPSSSSVVIDAQHLTVGHDDSESDDILSELSLDIENHEFGWDNESPRREIVVGSFKIDWRPITNGEYFAYRKTLLDAGGTVALPASWVEEDGSISVRTSRCLRFGEATYL